MIDTGDIDVFLGLDVGKGEHHATAVTPVGKTSTSPNPLRPGEESRLLDQPSGRSR
ncbi:hypothetical protein ABZ693_24645 [Streptomyces laurentii]